LKPKLGGIGTSQRHSQGTNLIKILVINNLSDNDWRKPIVTYLENPDGTTCRKIKYQALSYVLISGDLFKKTLEGVLLRCLGETEAYLVVSNTHSGAYGTHQTGHKMKWLLFRRGVYWPTMLKNCIEFAKGLKVGKTQEGGVELCFQKLFFLTKITTVLKIRV